MIDTARSKRSPVVGMGGIHFKLRVPEPAIVELVVSGQWSVNPDGFCGIFGFPITKPDSH